MPTTREVRESEKTLSYIWSIMPHLQVTVWHPSETDAIEHATDMMISLGKLIGQLKEQQTERWREKIKEPGFKNIG
uniref:Uncharacterized protein n=1 Tax=viral metagenome TaxID=1070528 RepID=A0A6H2A6P1_9ZZZZ